ncbi:MAG: hypothetical protein HYV07_17500 [Deltaproteobacteria bacterium]|nr:hypothetical protein [Deltaproteobacteria bacterium]
MLITLTVLVVAAGAVAEESIDRSVGRRNAELVRCFEVAGVAEGFAALRFRVGSDRRPHQVRVEDLSPPNAELSACLEKVILTLAFEDPAIGSDVAYPVRYQRAEVAQPPAETRRREAPRLSIGRNIQLFGDDWLVVDARGAYVSDLDLTARALDSERHRSLEGRESLFFVVAGLVGAVSVAAFGVAGYGAFRVSEDASDTVGLGLAVGALGASAVAGSISLYHLIRALDVTSGAPTWHHLEREEAERLIERANSGAARGAVGLHRVP